MRKQQIDKKIGTLIKHYDTRDPFRIAKEKGIAILLEELGDIYGYYNKVCRIPFIHINDNLDEHEQRFTCAHELGHALFHPNENTPKLLAMSLRSEILIEAEANYFATKLIVDGSHNDHYVECKFGLLQHYGLPIEMARFI